MKNYEATKMEIILLDSADIVTTSFCENEGELD